MNNEVNEMIEVEPDVEPAPARVDLNPRPLQRFRGTTLLPMDATHAEHPFFNSRLISEVRLQTLESEDALDHNLNFKYMDLQMMRVITPAPQSTANTYQRKKTGNSNSAVTFSRMFLCKVHSPDHHDDHNRIVYMMEARNLNSTLWSRNVHHRDSGSITIGSIFRVPCPLPIESWMRGDIPLIVSHFPVFLMKYPTHIPTIQMNTEIGGNTSLAFVYNGVDLAVDYTSLVKTSCTGSFCDKQRIGDWLGSRGCGCYGMASNSTSLAIQHCVTVTTFQDDKVMKDFSSSKFSKLYMRGDIPGSCKLYHLQLTEAYMKMLDCIAGCINLINENGGFTVVGWYKRGTITDKSMMAQDMNTAGYSNTVDPDFQCDAGEISYHIVQIVPSNRDFLDPTTNLGIELSELKFDVSDIQTN